MRKIFATTLLVILPPLFIIATIPLSSFNEHISHILLFATLGIGTAVSYLKRDLQECAAAKRVWKLSPSCSTIVFSVLLLFISTHISPCPYMGNSHNTQIVIDHPCSQPTTPGSVTISFSPVTSFIHHIAIQIPLYYFGILISNPDNKAPPVTS